MMRGPGECGTGSHGQWEGGPRRGGVRDWQLDMLVRSQESSYRLNGDVAPLV